jgi:hypothetical protein
VAVKEEVVLEVKEQMLAATLDALECETVD